MTTVINIKDAPEGWQSDPQYIYIGRAVPRKGLKRSLFANPFVIGEDGSREACVRKFEGWTAGVMHMAYGQSVRLLRGKTLVCWCAPLMCHGDVLAKLADELKPEEITDAT